MAIDIVLPIVLVLMILLIGTMIVVRAVRSRNVQQASGEASNARREARGDGKP
ncbi:hypothetical protein [Amnibacterium kyonggiense]